MHLSGLDRLWQTLASALILIASSCFAHGADAEPSAPLHQRIDQLIAAGNVAPLAPSIGDAAFARRIHLDLTGSIPSAAQARTFIADPAADKRARLIDDLLASSEHVHHLANTFDVWLMERRPAAHVKAPEWNNYLLESFAANKPYHELAREILSADGTAEKNRAAARFYLDRLGEPNLISRDVGRIFFGQDLQCAQCHDHPQISEYLQRDYHGMFAFFGRSYLFQPDKKQPAVLAEKALGGGEFKSVFTDVEGTEVPRLLHSRVEYPDPVFEPGEEYEVKPDPKNKKLQPIPKYSRRAQIAAAVADTNNPAFNRNIANRLWAQMMGSGLVEPFDFHHASNPPSHPELLELLADEFAAMNYDIRGFLRELALTETYQRRFEMPAELKQQAEKVQPALASLQAEESRLADLSRQAADVLDKSKAAWNQARIAATPHESGFAVADKKRGDADAASKKANDALAASKAAVDKVVSTTAEGKTDPKLAKLEADLAAKQKAADAAKTALDAAIAETEKLKKPLEAERTKVAAATGTLEDAVALYQAQKTAWKLAQRKQRDAEALIACAELLPDTGPAIDQARRDAAELAELEKSARALNRLAADLHKAAASAQAAREQVPDDVDLVIAASVLGDRSSATQARAQTAGRTLAARKAQVAAKPPLFSDLPEPAAVSLDELTGRWADAFAVGTFTQLTPEQLCNSMLRASGHWDKLIVSGEAAFAKKLVDQEAARKKRAEDAKKPADPKKKADAKAKAPEPVLTEADRERFVDDYLHTQVAAAAQRFIQLFGGQAGLPQSDFFATADQALYLSNDNSVRAWLRPSGDNLGGRLLKIDDPEELARELYLSVLTREPDARELAAVRDFLAARPEQKSAAVQDLSWALISSVEFRFKH